MNHGDMQRTSDEKSKVEQAQRDLRKKEEAEDKQWDRLVFTSSESDPVFEALAKDTDESLNADKTVGVWRFNWDAYRSLQRPFRGDLTPLGQV